MSLEMFPHEEPVLVRIIDDYGMPDYDTPDGQIRLNVECFITVVMITLGLLAAFGVW